MVENTKHFENLRHPQSSKTDVKLDGPHRPTAATRKLMCRLLKKWTDPLVDNVAVAPVAARANTNVPESKYLDTPRVLKSYGLSYEQVLD